MSEKTKSLEAEIAVAPHAGKCQSAFFFAYRSNMEESNPSRFTTSEPWVLTLSETGDPVRWRLDIPGMCFCQRGRTTYFEIQMLKRRVKSWYSQGRWGAKERGEPVNTGQYLHTDLIQLP